MNEEEVFNLDDCLDEEEDDKDRIKLDMQTLLKGEKTMNDDGTLPLVSLVD